MSENIVVTPGTGTRMHMNCSCPICVPLKYAPYNPPVLHYTPPMPAQSVQYGWVCPLCNSVYAPSVSECHKHGLVTTVTNENGSLIIPPGGAISGTLTVKS